MESLGQKTASILRQQCPRCHRGRLFTGLFHMRSECEECRLRFEREEGYWTGAMLINWLLVTFSLAPLWAVMMFKGIPLPLILLVTVALLFLLLPVFFRYSRVIWLHMDHRIDTEKE